MALKIEVTQIERRFQIVDTRMPFRYGPARLVRCPHLYLRVTIRDERGRQAHGIAADNLPPKWFDKNPHKSYAEEIRDQLHVIDCAVCCALSHEAATAFRIWLDVYNQIQTQAARDGLPKLLAGFGPSLIERAINDALGHLLDLPLHALLHSNELGVELGEIDSVWRSVTPNKVLPAAPREMIWARHTVGLSDPICNSDIPEAERLHDGLPQSLEDVVAFYGIRYFKIKIQNQLATDLERLSQIAALLDERLPTQKYFVTLDGNEQYNAMDELRPLLEALRTRFVFKRLHEAILFVEQPLARAHALNEERCRGIAAISESFPVIIDESDDSLESFGCALNLGYDGTSHKNCKNLFKSLANLARAATAQSTLRRSIILSAEDLTNIGPVALNQDLTALGCLGISHAERNGHHYFRGLSHLSEAEQTRALEAHPDVFTRDHSTLVRLDIRDGQIDCRSLHQTPGLGSGAWPDWESLQPTETFNAQEFA